MKSLMVSLMKGAATVGSIFDGASTLNEGLSYDTITSNSTGKFSIKNITLTTTEPGSFYIIFNIRGVETDYTHSMAKLEIKENVDYVTKVFRYFEGFIAFGIATTIIVAASYAFPVYLIPLCIVIMAVFCYYVWGQRDKGWYFIGIIYGLIFL